LYCAVESTSRRIFRTCVLVAPSSTCLNSTNCHMSRAVSSSHKLNGVEFYSSSPPIQRRGNPHHDDSRKSKKIVSSLTAVKGKQWVHAAAAEWLLQNIPQSLLRRDVLTGEPGVPGASLPLAMQVVCVCGGGGSHSIEVLWGGKFVPCIVLVATPSPVCGGMISRANHSGRDPRLAGSSRGDDLTWHGRARGTRSGAAAASSIAGPGQSSLA
jgi:hypothetical protein